jgi:hypothetical protein
MVSNLIHRKTDNTIIKKKTNNGRQPNTQKTENTIIKKTNNGWQPNTQKNRQYLYL